MRTAGVSIAMVGLVTYCVRSAMSELTAAEAIGRAREFIWRAGLPAPNPIPPGWQTAASIRATKTDSQFGFRVWEIQFYGDYSLKLDAVTGDLISFDNSRRVYEFAHRMNRTGVRKYRSEEEAKKRCASLARALGLPSRAGLDKFTLRSARGMIDAHYKDKPFGYPQLAGGNGTSLSVDPQDGQPVFVASHWRTRFAPPKRQVSAERAVTAAKQAYDHTGFHRGTYTPNNPPKLGYVVPNSALSGGPRHSPPVGRLAWVVRFGDESVWIDAETGRPIGWAIFKESPMGSKGL